ncbi:Amidase [Balamuthia mandrillaris]
MTTTAGASWHHSLLARIGAVPLWQRALTVAVVWGGVAVARQRMVDWRLRLNSRQIIQRKLALREAQLEAVQPPSNEEAEEFKRIASLSTQELLAELHSGKVSSLAVTRCFIFLAVAAHRRFNCLADVCFAEALTRAAELDRILSETGKPVGPLHGLPVSLKECFGEVNTDSTVGVAKNCFIQREDAVVVTVLKQAGAVIYAKTNVPQSMLTFETSNPVFGRTLNPWNLERTPGGSSGGEAVLLLAGGAPVGMGTDIGGSIRIPAAFCGIYGLKPTLGRLSPHGCVRSIHGQEAIKGTAGPMGLSVEDLALMMRLFSTEQQFHMDPALPPLPFNEEEYTSTKKLRIGYFTYDGYFEASPACQRAVREAARALENLGHELVEINARDLVDMHQLILLYFSLLSADGADQIKAFLHGEDIEDILSTSLRGSTTGPLLRRLVSFLLLNVLRWPRVAHIVSVSGLQTVPKIWMKQHQRAALVREVQLKWQEELQLDALLTPATAFPAIKHGFAKDLNPALTYTFAWNLLDFPCGVVPISLVQKEESGKRREAEEGVGDLLNRRADDSDEATEGLPVACQVVALPWQDERVLRIMREIEGEIPFRWGKTQRASLVDLAF